MGPGSRNELVRQCSVKVLWMATKKWFLVMLPKDNLSIDYFVYVIALMVKMVMVIRSGCIFYQPLSAATSNAFFVQSFCFVLWHSFILRKIL